MLDAVKKWASVFTLIQLVACVPTEPLSITLRNPKTNAVVNCTAHEDPLRPSGALSGAVELCAKQLEARGFVRVE